MSIKIRDFSDEDIPEIDKIHKKQPELGVPSLRHVLVNKVFEENGRIVGYGVIKIFSEAVLIIDKDISKVSKGRVLKTGMKIALDTCKKNKLEQLYLITSFPNFANILAKHYKARLCNGSTMLIDLSHEH